MFAPEHTRSINVFAWMALSGFVFRLNIKDSKQTAVFLLVVR